MKNNKNLLIFILSLSLIGCSKSQTDNENKTKENVIQPALTTLDKAEKNQKEADANIPQKSQFQDINPRELSLSMAKNWYQTVSLDEHGLIRDLSHGLIAKVYQHAYPDDKTYDPNKLHDTNKVIHQENLEPFLSKMKPDALKAQDIFYYKVPLNYKIVNKDRYEKVADGTPVYELDSIKYYENESKAYIVPTQEFRIAGSVAQFALKTNKKIVIPYPDDQVRDLLKRKSIAVNGAIYLVIKKQPNIFTAFEYYPVYADVTLVDEDTNEEFFKSEVNQFKDI